MRTIRIFSSEALAPSTEMELSPEAARHVAQVLRLRPGQSLVLFDGNGGEYGAEILAVEKRLVRVAIGQHANTNPESPLAISLWYGISRGDRVETVIQKATELGVARIVPVITERSIIKLERDASEKKQTHWRRIAISACEQCGRNQIPEILPPQELSKALLEPVQPGPGFLLDPRATQSLTQALPARPDALKLLCGPEGGFSDAETTAANAAGFESVRLGPRVLRTETAPLVALSIAQAVAGDLKT